MDKTALFRCGKLFDGIRDELQSEMEILIWGERIEKVGRHPPVPEGCESIDLIRKTVTPDMIDAHVYADAFDNDKMFQETVLGSSTYRALGTLHTLQHAPLRGFASIRVPGTIEPFDSGIASVARSVERGFFEGVRLGKTRPARVCGDAIYYLATIRDSVFLMKMDAAGRRSGVIRERGTVDDFDLCAESEDILAVCMYQGRLQELYAFSKKGHGGPRRLSAFNLPALRGRYVADCERISFSFRDYELDGWVLRPKDYDPQKSYPAVLDIHGGPKAAYGETFFHEMQVWAGRGYFVFFCNSVGSDGRGNDFIDMRGKYGTVDYESLMAFVDTVLEKYPQIDDSRVAVTGGSYGGYMTNWIISHTNRFACAVCWRSRTGLKSTRAEQERQRTPSTGKGAAEVIRQLLFSYGAVCSVHQILFNHGEALGGRAGSRRLKDDGHIHAGLHVILNASAAVFRSSGHHQSIHHMIRYGQLAFPSGQEGLPEGSGLLRGQAAGQRDGAGPVQGEISGRLGPHGIHRAGAVLLHIGGQIDGNPDLPGIASDAFCALGQALPDVPDIGQRRAGGEQHAVRHLPCHGQRLVAFHPQKDGLIGPAGFVAQADWPRFEALAGKAHLFAADELFHHKGAFPDGCDGLFIGDSGLHLNPPLVAGADGDDGAASGDLIQRNGLHGGQGGMSGIGVDHADADLDGVRVYGAGGGNGECAALKIVLRDPHGIHADGLGGFCKGNGLRGGIDAAEAKAEMKYIFFQNEVPPAFQKLASLKKVYQFSGGQVNSFSRI